LRRALSLSGPIDLEIQSQSPLHLQPVVIVDDVTRPGADAEFRGRHFRNTRTFSIAVGQTGSYWLFAEGPYGIGEPFPGGVIIDSIDVSLNSTTAQTFHPVLGIYPRPLVLNPGIPIAVTQRDVFFVDPMKTDAEPAPLQTGISGTQTAYAARPIWEMQIRTASGTFQLGPHVLPAGDIFLEWNSCLVFGTGQAVAQATTIYVNIAGRVF
jgi:hypothetical protein